MFLTDKNLIFKPVLDRFPYYEPENWGSEAKNGYTYKVCLNYRFCPNCHSKILAPDFRHEMDSWGNWHNFCRFCRPELKTAIN
jgi:hypothetical protein